MSILEAILFELKHNFINVSSKDILRVVDLASCDLDLKDTAIGSGINFYKYIGELL